MERLVYTSVARDDMAGDALFDIIQTSSRRNLERGITGFLAFSEGRFFQYVEGPTASLVSLLASLERDPRHHSIEILLRRPAQHSVFPGWRMKRVVPGTAANSGEQILSSLRAQGLEQDVISALEHFFSDRAAA